jgi:hypothetical protein
MSTQRFEYLVHEIKHGFLKAGPDIAKVSEELTRLGSQGWELVTQLQAPSKLPTSTALIFKRAR